MHRVVNGQVQRIDLRTSVGVLVTVDAVAGSRVDLTVALRPGVGTARFDRVDLMHRVVNGQVQRIDLRAAVCILVTVGTVAGSRVGLSVALRPSVGTACFHRDGGMHRIVNGQVQRIHLRAAVGILVAVGVVAGSCVGDSVNPRVVATGRHGEGFIYRRVHHQHHRHDGVAAVGGGQRGVLRAGAVEGLPIPNVGQFVDTYLAGLHHFESIGHRQRHRHHTVAASNRLQCDELRAGGSEGDFVPVVGHGGRTHRALLRYCVARIHRQREHNHAVATVDGVQRVRVGVGGGQRLSEEVVALALTDGRTHRRGVLGIDMQGHRHHTVAAVDRLQRGGLRVSTVEGHAVPLVRQLGGTNRRLVGHREGRVDRQREHDHAVAAVDGVQRVRVGVGGGQRLSEEVVALALTDGRAHRRGVLGIDMQGHRHHTVAAIGRLQRGGLRVSSVEGHAVPLVRQLGRTNRRLVGHRVGRIDRQSEGDDTVATSLALQRVRVGVGDGQRLSEEVVAAALADGRAHRRVVGRVQRQNHGHDGVATVGGGQRDSL